MNSILVNMKETNYQYFNKKFYSLIIFHAILKHALTIFFEYIDFWHFNVVETT